MIELKVLETAGLDLLKIKQEHYRKFIKHMVLRRGKPGGANDKADALKRAKEAFEESDFWLPWALNTIRGEGSSTFEIIPPVKPFTNYQRGCFYNALSYVNQHPESELAVGVLIFKHYENQVADYIPKQDELMLPPTSERGMHILHGFAIVNGKVVDPTLGLEEKGMEYVYRIVPKQKWSGIKWKPNDRKGNGFDEVEAFLRSPMKSEFRAFDIDGFLKGASDD